MAVLLYQASLKRFANHHERHQGRATRLGYEGGQQTPYQAVWRGKVTPAQMGETFKCRIRPTLNYGDFGETDIVIEAVVENPKLNTRY